MGQRWMHVDLEPRTGPSGSPPRPSCAIRADARAFLRAANARLKEAVLLAEPAPGARPPQRRGPRGLGGRDGRRRGRLDRARASTPAGSSPTSGGSSPTTRSSPPTPARSAAGRRAGSGSASPGTFLGPTSGAMGYGFPAALAAALVHRERRVVALVGDGGMGMSLAEVETAVREGAHVVAIVFDNERYGMIRAYQDRQGSATAPGTDLGPLDFAAAARACGARGVRVETDAAFEGALRTALAAVRADGDPGHARPPLGERRRARDGRRGVTRPTLHLVPEAVWEARDPAEPYLPGGVRGGRLRPLHRRRRGDGGDANRFYRDDPQPFLLLTLDLDRTGSPWRFDDPSGIYPHVYGPIDPASVTAVRRMVRDADGTFRHPAPR